MLYILGAGSLGLLWAARLQQADIACRVIVRNAEQLQAWQQRSNRLLFNDGTGNHTLTLNFETPDTARMIRHLIVAIPEQGTTAASLGNAVLEVHARESGGIEVGRNLRKVDRVHARARTCLPADPPAPTDTPR